MNDKELAAAYKAQRDALIAFMENAPVNSGVCCCGDDMNRHGNPMACGHSPVDMWDHSVICWREDIDKFDKSLSERQDLLGKA